MNLLFLLFVLIVLLGIVYIINDFDYIVPSFFMIGSFFISAMISFLAIDRWQYIRFNTTIIVIIGLISFTIGDFCGSKIDINIPKIHIRIAPSFAIKKTRDIWETSIVVSKKLIIVISCFMIIIDYYYFRYIYDLSVLAGNTQGYSQMFEYARRAVIDVRYNIPMAFWLEHGTIIVECLGFVFLYIFIYNIIISKKVVILNLIPCMLYIISLMISTARIDVINYVCAIIVFYSIISLKKDKKSIRLRPKVVLYAVLAIIVVLVSFRLLGYLTGKSNTRELWTDLSTYGGSSIPALDKYINSPKKENIFFGQESLNRFYAVLRILNLTDIRSYDTTLPFVHFPDGTTTNIYTGFRRYIQDYGYVGMIIVLFFMGGFYGVLNKMVKKTKNIGIGLIIYAYIFYPVVMTFVDERFIISFTSLSLPYHMIYFLIIYKVIVGKKKENETSKLFKLLELNNEN